jgi:hypothetical protein
LQFLTEAGHPSNLLVAGTLQERALDQQIEGRYRFGNSPQEVRCVGYAIAEHLANGSVHIKMNRGAIIRGPELKHSIANTPRVFDQQYAVTS